MYKKITHNIIEEHFGMPMPEEKEESSSKSGIPTTTVFNEETFRKDVDTYLKKYGEKIISMLNQVTGSEEDLVKTFEELFVNIDDLGNMTKNFYASDLGERININMRSMALLSFLAINNLKLGRDPLNNFNRVNNNLTDLAMVLSTFNSLWSNSVLRATLLKLTESIFNKVKARKEKNSSAEQIANASILEQLKLFGDAISNGIVSKFPERFSITAKLSDRDIM